MKPDGIIRIYDNPNWVDRYTVVLHRVDYPARAERGRFYPCLSLSDNPDSPNGISQASDCQLGGHLGHEIEWEDLPAPIREHIVKRLK